MADLEGQPLVSVQARGEMLMHLINIYEHISYVRLGTQT